MRKVKIRNGPVVAVTTVPGDRVPMVDDEMDPRRIVVVRDPVVVSWAVVNGINDRWIGVVVDDSAGMVAVPVMITAVEI
jgi:hypothetical protein